MKKNIIAPLYDRVKFTAGNTDSTKYDYKFTGSNYTPSLTTKDIAVIIRKHLKIRFPEVKFSVTSEYKKIWIEIKASPYDYKQLEYSEELEFSAYRKYELENNKEIISIVTYANDFLGSYNYDDSDSMTDYFDTKFYASIKIDYDYKQTEQTEDQKIDIVNFRQSLAEAKQQKKEKERLYIQEQIKKQELDQLKFEELQKQQKSESETIKNNVSVVEIAENEQYMITNIKMANINRNGSIVEYQEEINKGDFYCNDMKVTRELHFTSYTTLKLFKNMLLCNFDFIAGTGGTYTDDERINDMQDYYKMTKEEQQTVKWNLYGIAVYFDGELQFIIDAQGHNYARYVGITDQATNYKPIKESKVLTSENSTGKEKNSANMGTSNIIDFCAKLKQRNEERQKKEESDRAIKFFNDNFAKQEPEFLKKLADAIEQKDIEKYKELTEPIIRRNAIREFNKN